MEYTREAQEDSFGRTIGTVSLILAAAALLFVLHLISHTSYTLFHSLAEGFSICISVAIFMFAWNSRRFMDNHYVMLLGIASLFIGFMDGIHTLAYKGMGVFGGHDPNPATQVWIATRYVQALSFLVAPLFLKRKLKPTLAFAAYAAVTALSLLSIFSWKIFPACFIEGSGLTPFKIASEYAIVAILLASLGAVFSLRRSFDPGISGLISWSIVFSIAAELAFTQYLGVYDLMNQLGHVLKIVASYLLYRSVIFTGLRKPYNLVFRDLSLKQEELNRANLVLKSLAAEQRSEIGRRRQAEEELRIHRDRLEEMVHARTAELEERTLKLAEEIEVRMKTEEDLQKTVKTVQDLYDNAPCGYHSLNPDGFFLGINQTELAWIGYTKDEVIGKLNFGDILTPQSAELFKEKFPLFKEQGRISDLEFEMVRKDGTIMPVVVSSTAVRDDRGEYVMSRTTLFDITERRKMEAERRRAEEEKKKLEAQLIQTQKMDALGRFAGGIAHDLNNMLYPIILNAQSLLKEIPTDAPWRLSIQLILDASTRQRDLVKQILSFSRHQEQKLVPIRVKPLLDETLAFMRSTLPKTIRIVEDTTALNDTILGNETQIQQVIMNLCRNAADAIGHGTGVLEVQMGNRRPEPGGPAGEAGEYVWISIRDNGCGMEPDVVNRIFDPFFTTKPVGKGTGMGLAVVHGIMKNHGGEIKVESEPGKGTLFTIEFPLTRELPVEKKPAKDFMKQAGEKKRILLVDDEEIILKSLRRVLKLLGYDVTTSKGSQEALDLFTASPDAFDVIITDQTMPAMTGLELSLEALKARSDIPIVLCTGFTDAIDENKVRKLGIRELLMKPAEIDEIREAIDRAVEPGGKGV